MNNFIFPRKNPVLKSGKGNAMKTFIATYINYGHHNQQLNFSPIHFAFLKLK